MKPFPRNPFNTTAEIKDYAEKQQVYCLSMQYHAMLLSHKALVELHASLSANKRGLEALEVEKLCNLIVSRAVKFAKQNA